MKLVLVLAVVLFGIWLWRTNREAQPKRNLKNPESAAVPLDMVCCALCSVHVPVADAVKGKKGVYCGADHFHRAEQ